MRQESVFNRQVGGNHYQLPVRPIDFIYKNNLGYMEGTAIKYLVRWRNKGGVEDLRKAQHFIDMLIEFELEQEHNNSEGNLL